MKMITVNPNSNPYTLDDSYNEIKLRDKIAIASINGLLLRRDQYGKAPEYKINEIGKLAYCLADEIIKHRNKT